MLDKKLTIQLVGWNSAKELPAGLEALSRIPPTDVAITYIDNASEDASVALVQRMLPQAKIIQLLENTGFAHAHNIGFMQVQTPYVMLHNPDFVIAWEGVQQLLQEFDDPRIAALQGKLLHPDMQHFDSAGIVLTRALNGRDRGANEVDRGQYEAVADLTAVTGACGIYRLSALRAVAYAHDEIFDEDFFAYKEDVDLGWRLVRAGWRIRYYPVVMGTHTRAVRATGTLGWNVHPVRVYRRLQSPRTRYSIRNWIWMIAKNVSLRQLLWHELFIDVRLLTFFLLSICYPPLLRVWLEILQKMPRMLAKREHFVQRISHIRRNQGIAAK